MSKSSRTIQAKVDGEIYKGGRTERDINGVPHVPSIGVGMTMADFRPLDDVMEGAWVRVAEVVKNDYGTFARLQWLDDSGEIFEEVKLVRHPDGRKVEYTGDGLRAKRTPLIKIEPQDGGSAA